ncbi:MAG: hypothetical protein K2R98_31800 [Gemmataceae bacterium]|nr:hypothetical protein [Gemmataceae bacterium]
MQLTSESFKATALWTNYALGSAVDTYNVTVGSLGTKNFSQAFGTFSNQFTANNSGTYTVTVNFAISGTGTWSHSASPFTTLTFAN